VRIIPDSFKYKQFFRFIEKNFVALAESVLFWGNYAEWGYCGLVETGIIGKGLRIYSEALCTQYCLVR
jgi:hypothetical protein